MCHCHYLNNNNKENTIINKIAANWKIDSNGCNDYRRQNKQIVYKYMNTKITEFQKLFGKENYKNQGDSISVLSYEQYVYIIGCRYKNIIKDSNGNTYNLNEGETLRLIIHVDHRGNIIEIQVPRLLGPACY
jgi:hypothetical protein